MKSKYLAEMAKEKESPKEESKEIEMPKKDFYQEHKKLIHLLRSKGHQFKDKELLAEADKQESECESYK